MSEIYLPHSFFDPSSRYNRLREACDSNEKLLGYFDWLNYQRQIQAQEHEAPPMAAAGGPIVVRLDNPELHVQWKHMDWPRTRDLEGPYFVEFQLKEEDRPSRRTRCRVLLMEPEVLKRLRVSLTAEGRQLHVNDEKAVRGLFAGDILESSFEVCRVLSALPELEGDITEGGHGIAERGVPFRSANVPQGTWIIVVYEPPPIEKGN